VTDSEKVAALIRHRLSQAREALAAAEINVHDAFLQRQAADYGTETGLTREEVDTLVAHATEFLASVRRYLPDGSPPTGDLGT
jgi:uncharacterized protein (UPF0332 family)